MELKRLSKYEIKRQLGRGAMGIVYEAWDPIIKRQVAIKTVRMPHSGDADDKEAHARFLREATAAGNLNHPNIVTVYDYGETEDHAYIVMEYIDGPSLKSLMDEDKHFDLARTRRIMQDILAGLQFSHERDVVHRDIKPANVMLTSTGQAKIADFGLARTMSSSMTVAGTVMGTPAYMSPEQFKGIVADARTDIYSTGVLLYQLLTGEPPFKGDMTAIMHAALNSEPPAPSQISGTAPKTLDIVVRRAMAKEPHGRYPTAAAFAEAIQTHLSTARSDDDDSTIVRRKPDSALPPGAPSTPKPRVAMARKPLLGLLVALVAVVVMAGAGWWLLAPPAVRPPVPPDAQVTRQSEALQTPIPGDKPASEPRIERQPNTTPVETRPPPDAPPQSAVVSPAPPPVIDVVAIGRQIDQFLVDASCALLHQDMGANGVRISGIAGTTTSDQLRQKVAEIATAISLTWDVRLVDPVFCAALDILRPISPLAGARDDGLRVSLQDNRIALTDGEHLRPRITMADFAGQLRVDFLLRDGSVVHLFPTLPEPVMHWVRVPARLFNPGESLKLGDDLRWRVEPPPGLDMMIAIASPQPLLQQSRTENTEDDATGYLRGIQAAIQAARLTGTRVTAAVLLVETIAKGN